MFNKEQILLHIMLISTTFQSICSSPLASTLIKPTCNLTNCFHASAGRSNTIEQLNNDPLIDSDDAKLDIDQFINSKASSIDANVGRSVSSKRDVDLEDALRLKCYLNIIHSFMRLQFVDIMLVRKNQIRTSWYRRNARLCRSMLQFQVDSRLFPGLIELKLYKLKLIYLLIRWKVEVLVKFNIWFLVIAARIKQAILGRHIIRDEDIDLLIRLFYPELFQPMTMVRPKDDFHHLL